MAALDRLLYRKPTAPDGIYGQGLTGAPSFAAHFGSIWAYSGCEFGLDFASHRVH
jgi:hypothetical protein